MTPPRNIPTVILKQKQVYIFWLQLHRNFPKAERLGIGIKIEQNFLSVLELSFLSSYLPYDQKIVGLSKSITKMDTLKFFVQLAWESKLIPTDKYSELSSLLDEIGRMLGGWKKGLETKLPPK